MDIDTSRQVVRDALFVNRYRLARLNGAEDPAVFEALAGEVVDGLLEADALVQRDREATDVKSSVALTAALAEGFPRSLFLGMCDWLEEHPTDSPRVALRYAPNTRAEALRLLRRFTELRDILGS